MNLDLAHPTPGERLLLDRRRKGLAKPPYAATLGLGRNRYDAVEADLVSPPCRVPTLRPTWPEQCYLARRRLGWNHVQLAHAMAQEGNCMYRQHGSTVELACRCQEREADPVLVEFYQKRGFTFR